MLHTKKLSTITQGIDRLKLFSLFVVAWFTLLFNIERFDWQGKPLINLTNSLYLITMFVGIVILAFPNLQRANFLATGIFFEGVLLGSYGFVEREETLLVTLVVESILLGMTLWIMQRLSIYLEGVEAGVESLVLTDDSSHILPYDEAIRQAELEFQNLGNRPVTIVYCTLSSDDANFLNLSTAEEILNWNMEKMYHFRLRQVQLGRQIMSLTYLGDIIFEYRNGIVVCLLEVDEQAVQPFIYKLHRFVGRFEHLTLWAGTASYPCDGQNFHELLEMATQNLRLYEPPDDATISDHSLTGDVRVGLEERLRIKEASAWVDELAYQSPTSRSIYRTVKQMIDSMGASLILLALSPIFLVIATLIIITDGRPIFYEHDRVGLGGKSFKMLKFRSMYRNAKPLEPVIVELPDGTTRMDWPDKLKDDPRVTPVGRPLRKWSIDELPQFINVLRGDMSLIGPRPSSWGLEKHTLLQTARLSVKPGITGLWQVCSRDTKNFDERLIWDLKYVQKMSLWLDIQILLRTAGAVLRRTGV
jgi:lipopolysaccharide/colanic/teichoic acid biosynthesis glycosyltransferase